MFLSGSELHLSFFTRALEKISDLVYDLPRKMGQTKSIRVFQEGQILFKVLSVKFLEQSKVLCYLMCKVLIFGGDIQLIIMIIVSIPDSCFLREFDHQL